MSRHQSTLLITIFNEKSICLLKNIKWHYFSFLFTGCGKLVDILSIFNILCLIWFCINFKYTTPLRELLNVLQYIRVHYRSGILFRHRNIRHSMSRYWQLFRCTSKSTGNILDFNFQFSLILLSCKLANITPQQSCLAVHSF